MTAPIRIFRSGAHAHRCALAYPALASLFAGVVVQVADPAEADLHVFTHVLDLQDIAAAVMQDWRRRRRPVVILSEEPFWDTIWGRRPLDRHRIVDTRLGALPVVQLNHATSGIFRFDRIPYYLLTHHRFAAAYAARFRRNAARRPAGWQADFAARPMDLSFLFERRPERFHDVAWPAADIAGLCAWRTDLALACDGPRVERLGQSWQGGPTRFELANWHLDKIVRLDGRARMIGAIENTHQPDYLTEKLFDAFACGARPLYAASAGHRVHDLGLPPGSWLNLQGLTAAAAAETLAATVEDAAFFAAFAEAQARLAALFGDPGLILAERDRLRRALLGELRQVLDAAD